MIEETLPKIILGMALQQLYLIYSNGLTWKLRINKNGQIKVQEETQFNIGKCGPGGGKCCGYFAKYERSFLHMVYGGDNHPSLSYNLSSNKIGKMDNIEDVKSIIPNNLVMSIQKQNELFFQLAEMLVLCN